MKDAGAFPDSERSALGSFDSDDWMRRTARAAESVPLGEIAGYRIVRVVGRGAQGTVYEAIEPRSGRRVAVKRVPRFDHDTVEAARFAREIDALAALGHPNAVGLLAAPDADGARVIVMEWIDGLPLDAWSDAQWSTRGPREAAECVASCLARIASAIAAAHARGIMHRDLKPSNVLVTADGEPKVLDFGLAKEIGSSRDATRTGGFAGTPSWAAPEQVAGSARDVDARTDVHALGLLLYRALAGKSAFDGTLAIAPLFESIRDRTPPAPSRMRSVVPKELDLIALRALEKNPALRYQTAEAFERDLRRHLAGEPIDAHPPSSLYLVRKFVSRHRVATAAVVIATTAVLAGTVATVISAIDANEARNAAIARADEADRARTRAERMNGFFQDLLANVRERDAAGEHTDAKEVLALAAQSLERADTPRDAEGDLRATLGRAFFEIGDYPRSVQQYQRAVELLAGSGDEREHAKALLLLARAELRGLTPAVAIGHAREAVAMLARCGAPAAERAEAAECLAFAANATQATREAGAAIEEALVLSHEARDQQLEARALSTKALILESEGSLKEAAAAAVAAAEIARKSGASEVEARVRLLHNAGYLLSETGRPTEALPYLEESLALRSAHYGTRHPAMITARTQLAGALRSLRRYDESVALHLESLSVLQDDSPATCALRSNVLRHLGRVYQSRASDGDAERVVGVLRDSVRDFARGGSTNWIPLQGAARNLFREIESQRGVDGLRAFASELNAELESLTQHPMPAAIARMQFCEHWVDPRRGAEARATPDMVRSARADVALAERVAGRDSHEAFLAELALAHLLRSTGADGDAREARDRATSVEMRATAASGENSGDARSARAFNATAGTR